MTSRAGSVCQPPVAGEQSYIQRFGESDIGGVVDGKVVAEFPAAGQQGPVGCSLEWQSGKVGQRQRGTAQISRASVHLPP